MRQKSMSKNDPAERTVRDIRRKTRKQYTAEEKIRIVVSGLRGEESIAALRRLEGDTEEEALRRVVDLVLADTRERIEEVPG